MQYVVEVEDLLLLALHELGERYARPARYHARDLLFRDGVAQERVLLLALAACFVQLFLEFRQTAVLELRRLGIVAHALRRLYLAVHLLYLRLGVGHGVNALFLTLPLCFHLVELVVESGKLLPDVGKPLLGEIVRFLGERHLLYLQLHDLARDVVHLGGHGVDLRTDGRARLVHEVDRLVGQESVRDVSVRESRRRDERAVVYLHAVIHFVPFLKPPQYGYGVLHGGLVHHDGLETAFQRGVLLDVLAVLVQRCRAYAMQLAPCEHRFEQIARVHRAVGLARADYGVQLVDEEDDAPFALADLVQHRLQPFLELAAEFRPRDERAHIQGEDGLVLQPLRDVAAHYALRKPLHDSRLAHAGLAYEDGIVLGLAREDTDDVPYLVVPADDGVELLLFRAFHEVETVLVEHIVGILRLVARHPVRLYLLQLHKEGGLGHAERAEDVLYLLRRMVEQRQHDVLHRHIFVPGSVSKPFRA